MSGVRSEASAPPMFIRRLPESLPTFGALWQGEQGPLMRFFPVTSFSPATPVIANVLVLKSASPRPIERRFTSAASDAVPVSASQALKIVKALGLNEGPPGTAGKGSLIPGEYGWSASASGPPVAPRAFSG